MRDASVPYSLVAAVDDYGSLQPSATSGGASIQEKGGSAPILLNDWTARELGARVGDELRLSYYVWHEEGRLETRVAPFRIAGVVAIAGAAADRDLVPDYPGITREARLADWDPPFPVDLKTIRPQDEAYWQRYRTTPKAWLPLAAGQALWGHRLGRTTSLRLTAPAEGASAVAAAESAAPEDVAAAFGRRLAARLTPGARGLVVEDVRARALTAARGATDFGQYFVYFSFFLVVAALLLAGLFFRFGVEQRLGELGLLQAIGFAAARVRRTFLAEALVLAGLGALLGMAGAVAYAWLMMLGLRTVWVGAVGTRALGLAVGPLELAAGALGGIAAAGFAIWATLRGLRGRSVRGLLARAPQEWGPARGSRRQAWAALLAGAAAALLGIGALGLADATVTFFGAGALVLAASLSWVAARLRGERQRSEAAAAASVRALGFRQAAFRPGRSVLAVALVAFAAFVIVSVGAFRHEGRPASGKTSETGGFALLARSVVPLHHDPGTADGREALGLDARGAQRRTPRPLPHEAGRGRELPQPLSAGAAHARRADRGVPARGPLRVPEEPGGDRGGARQPVAAARGRQPRRSDPGRRRRRRAAVRAAPPDRRELRARRHGSAAARRRRAPAGAPAVGARDGRAPLPRGVPGRGRLPLLPDRERARPGSRRGRGARVAARGLRLRRRERRGAARRVPPRREHLHRDVPDARRARPAARDARDRRRAGAQRLRAAPRARALARGRLPGGAHPDHGARRVGAAAAAGARDRHGRRARRDPPGARRARDAALARPGAAARGGGGPRRPAGVARGRDAPCCACRCSSRCARSRIGRCGSRSACSS